MKQKIMENALDSYTNRFQLTMMAVARAKELNEGESALTQVDEHSKPVVLALKEIAEGKVVPATQEEMNRIREARRVLRERSLREAEEQESLQEEDERDEAFASADPEEEPIGS